MLLLLPMLNTQAEILIEVKVGDSWVYSENTYAQYLNKNYVRTVEKINYTVNGREYYPINDEEYLPANNVTQSKYINLFDEMFNSVSINFGNETDNINAYLRYTLKETREMNNYYTARGSFNFRREIKYIGKIESTLYNGTVELKSTHTFTNLDMMKTLVTGNAYKSQEMFIISCNPVEIDEEYEFSFKIMYTIELLFTSSDKFIYNERECRNMTIQTSRVILNVASIQIVDKHNISNTIQYSIENLPFSFKRNEKWIYSYSIGIPLLIKQNFSSSSTIGKQIRTAFLDRKLILEKYDIKNAKEEAYQTTSNINTTSSAIYSIAGTIAAVLTISRRKKKE